ncbi:hypothetical protein ACP0HM_31765 [Escherichia coli]
MALGIEKAHQHGIAAVALHNFRIISAASVTGREQCAAAGFDLYPLSLAWSDVSNGRAVPSWSRQPLAPIRSVWFSLVKIISRMLLDYATSAVAFGKTRVVRVHKGVPVPPGCLIDVNVACRRPSGGNAGVAAKVRC